MQRACYLLRALCYAELCAQTMRVCLVKSIIMSVNRYLGNRAGSALLRNDVRSHTPALGRVPMHSPHADVKHGRVHTRKCSFYATARGETSHETFRFETIVAMVKEYRQHPRDTWFQRARHGRDTERREQKGVRGFLTSCARKGSCSTFQSVSRRLFVERRRETTISCREFKMKATFTTLQSRRQLRWIS